MSKEYDEFSISFQVTETIEKKLNKVFAIVPDCVFDIIHDELLNLRINEIVRENYSEVEEYKSMCRKHFSNEIAALKETFPEGIYSKRYNEYTSCNVLMKSFLSRCYSAKETENAQLMEALREIIKECEEWVITGAETSNNCENNHYVEIDDLKSLITKSKQLLTDKPEDDEKG